ncbi:MAG: hypothetical protein P1U56_17050 [Saprospiraceae bacterium]|nr:hypothetical protein [Saprospiraceae bacterium]
MLKKIIRIIGYSLLIIPLFILVDFNCAQHYSPTFETTDSSIFNRDVYHQLQHLKETYQKGAAKEMQHIYPEGFIFFNALYALSWTEFVRSIPESSDLHKEGLNEITKAWEAIDSENGKSIFNAQLPLPYGAFYAGWNNYVLGSKLSIQSPEMRDSTEVQLFEKYCAIIAESYASSEYPFLESYGYGSWPADNVVAIASLSLHDKILEAKYTKNIQDWLDKIKTHLDRPLA